MTDKRTKPRKGIAKKLKRGRPKFIIDWKVVDKLLEADCEGTEIAAHLGIGPDTLYDRCVKENDMIFSEYLREKKANGNSLLKVAQFKKAMSGDNTMLIWQGKQRLGQRDRKDVDVTTKGESVAPLCALTTEELTARAVATKTVERNEEQVITPKEDSDEETD